MRGRKKEWKKKEIIELYRKKSLKRNRPYTYSDIEMDRDMPSPSLIMRKFKTIRKLRRKAGIKPVITCYDTRKMEFVIDEKRGVNFDDFSMKDKMKNKDIREPEDFCIWCVHDIRYCDKNVEDCIKEGEEIIEK